MASLFPNYSQGENRVTYAMVSVFERIDSRLLDRILSAMTGNAVSTMSFRNQPRLTTSGRQPDALVSAHLHWYFEVKRESGALVGQEESKLRDYLRELDGLGGDAQLVTITPDGAQPSVIASIEDPRLSWISFADLHAAIDAIITPPDDAEAELLLLAEAINDRDRFLLRELQALFVDDDLLGGPDVVIVAANNAYPEYKLLSAYICQPESERTFQPQISRLGFYAKGAIQPEVPIINARRGEVEISPDNVQHLRSTGDPTDQAFAEVIQRYMTTSAYAKSTPMPFLAQVFLLARPDDPETALFVKPIKNTTKAGTGRGYGWTLKQRYTRSDALRRGPATTDDLANVGG